MTPNDHSRAWQLGRDAALAGSHRKPPKGASAQWQAEYWQGWQDGHTSAQNVASEWKEHAKTIQEKTA